MFLRVSVNRPLIIAYICQIYLFIDVKLRTVIANVLASLSRFIQAFSSFGYAVFEICAIGIFEFEQE